MKKLVILVSILVFGIQFSCNTNQTTPDDTPRRGKKTMYLDESFKPFIKTASEVFTGIYPDAELNLVYTSESNAMKALSEGTARTIFTGRDYTKKEKKYLRSLNITVTSEIIAHDAITFIVNLENTDTLLTQNQIRDLLTGKSTVWPNSQKPIEVVFDRVQSANFNFMLNWIGSDFGKQIHAAKNTEDLIKYVQNNPNTLGIIGYNFLSDFDDPEVKARSKKIRVVGIQANDKYYWRPNKANIMEKKYPFCRAIWAINSGAPDGLNTGFVTFLSGRQGQLLLEKCELGPGKGTPREINFITE
ncbi:PstS family phosphate ABC transporter substrate-binding protein [Fluviicola sp.]|uniref:PstS family phosphate ABC transporter substrate-binding protein n=1 Tax=Fluviicola sp. TaxID=1917219 RepID=UPI003D292C88